MSSLNLTTSMVTAVQKTSPIFFGSSPPGGVHLQQLTDQDKACLLVSADAAVRWWCEWIRKQQVTSSVEMVKKFEGCLRECILEKITDHWYPELPAKGQGYRSLTMDKKAHCDPELQKAAVSAGITEPFVSFMKDIESINMWIDPDAVIVRISYTGYVNIPPEEKVLYRSPLSIKVAIFPYPTKTPTVVSSPPSSPNRNHNNNNSGVRVSPLNNVPIRPSTPPQAGSYPIGSYRSSSPGLTSTSAPYIPYAQQQQQHSNPYTTVTSVHKNPFTGQQQRNVAYYNNQSQFTTGWYNGHSISDNWNDNNYSANFYQNANYTTTGTTITKQQQQAQPQQPQQMYGDYLGPELPLETQA